MKQIVSFDKLKLTNNLLDDNGHVSVTFSFFLFLNGDLLKNTIALKKRYEIFVFCHLSYLFENSTDQWKKE